MQIPLQANVVQHHVVQHPTSGDQDLQASSRRGPVWLRQELLVDWVQEISRVLEGQGARPFEFCHEVFLLDANDVDPLSTLGDSMFSRVQDLVVDEVTLGAIIFHLLETLDQGVEELLVITSANGRDVLENKRLGLLALDVFDDVLSNLASVILRPKFQPLSRERLTREARREDIH